MMEYIYKMFKDAGYETWPLFDSNRVLVDDLELVFVEDTIFVNRISAKKELLQIRNMSVGSTLRIIQAALAEK